MHMADALLSPAVGGAMWAVSAGLLGYSAKKLRAENDDRKVPLMGVMGAFIFTAQMINFSIPGTGSSGHIGGGLLLAILLGPYAGFLTIASVLVVQALFFADGGLLALGSNIFNMGFFSCFIAYPFVFKPLLGTTAAKKRLTIAAILAAIIGLELGAAGVVAETIVSGITELPVATFAALMLPIHLAIGLVEGILTAAVAAFVLQARPELLDATSTRTSFQPLTAVLTGLGIAALITGGIIAWFASGQPDGLEWSVAGTAGSAEIAGAAGPVHQALGEVQEQLAPLPDYGFPAAGAKTGGGETTWPAVEPGTSAAGIIGGMLTLIIAGGIGVLLRRRSAPPA